MGINNMRFGNPLGWGTSWEQQQTTTMSNHQWGQTYLDGTNIYTFTGTSFDNTESPQRLIGAYSPHVLAAQREISFDEKLLLLL